MASVDFESAWLWLQAVLAEGPVREALGVGLAAFVVVMLLGKIFSRRHRDEADLLRERLREVELKLEAARGEVAVAKRAQAEFEKGDPTVFARALADAVANGGPGAKRVAPEAWLDPLRPALADAYLRLARGVLGKAKGEEDLDRARTMAWGALAAVPERTDCANLLARIDEAERLGLFRELSEADALAWRIARQDFGDSEGAAAHGVVTRSRGPIGYSMLLSGWEDDELHAAALAELGGRVESAAEAGAAQEGGQGRAGAGRRADAGGGAAIEGARVVALSNGGATDDDEEAEEARVVGAAAGRRGQKVLVMPVGRGGRGGSGSGTGDSGPQEEAGGDEPADASERELGLRRLWERRRRPDMLGEMHPRTLAARANIGHEAGRLGRHGEAESIFREVLEAMVRSEVLGEQAHDTLAVRHNLGVELLRQEKLDEAEAEFKTVLGELGSPAGRGRNDPLALAAAHGLAEVWLARDKPSEAEAAFGAVWRARSADPAWGPDHPYTLWSRVRMLRAAEAAEAAAD